MWRIRVNQLYSEVGGLISGARVKFITPGGHEHNVSGKISTPDGGYTFEMPGKRGDLKTVHGDRVVLDFDVLLIIQYDDTEQTAWNDPSYLAPVGSPLLIKMPKGTAIHHEESQSGAAISTEDHIVSVIRTKHLQEKGGEMEYRLKDGSTVTGRFHWTHT